MLYCEQCPLKIILCQNKQPPIRHFYVLPCGSKTKAVQYLIKRFLISRFDCGKRRFRLLVQLVRCVKIIDGFSMDMI